MTMRWTGFSGGWKKLSSEIERAVRESVRTAMKTGNGIVVGGALGVDFLVLDEALKIDPSADRIKVFLPTPLEIYAAYNRSMAEQGFMTTEQSEQLNAQLTDLRLRRAASLIENPNTEVNKRTFYERNESIVNASDELRAFHIVSELSDGPGTVHTIEKAREKGIPVEVMKYDLTKSK